MKRRLATQVSWIGIALLAAGLAVGTAWAGGTGDQPEPEYGTRGHFQPHTPSAECDVSGGVAGLVSAVGGAAFAQAPGQQPRALNCNDPVHACDVITTEAGGHVALLVDDVYLQLGDSARVTLKSTEASFFVHAGEARVIDTRLGNPASFALATPQLESSGVGADAEVRVSAAADTRFCSFGDPMSVTIGESTRQLGAGNCLSAAGFAANDLGAGTPSLGFNGALECRPNLAYRHDWDPADVGPPPPISTAFARVDRPNSFAREACDDPGSGCAGGPPPAIIFKGQQPNTGCGFPGAVCP